MVAGVVVGVLLAATSMIELIPADAAAGSGPTSHHLSVHQVGDAAAPLAFGINGPSAVFDATTETTFFAWPGAGRDLYVASIDHLTGEITGPVLVDANPLADPSDDHLTPSMAIDQSGHVHIVWGSHNTAHRHCKSDAARGIGAWTCQDMPSSGTYPNLVVADNGDLLVFDRAGSGHGAVFPSHEFAGVYRSTDAGATWSAHTAIIDVTGHPDAATDVYLSAVSVVGGLVHLSWFIASGAAHDDTRQNVYHATYDPTTGDLATIGGTSLGSSITWAEHSSIEVFSGSDVPIVRHHVVSATEAYVAFSHGAIDSGASGTWEAKVAVWDGSSWTTTATGVDHRWRFADVQVFTYKDEIVGLFPERGLGEAWTDLIAMHYSDGAWSDAGRVIGYAGGEGISRLGAVSSGGPWIALAQSFHDGWGASNAEEGVDWLPPIFALTVTPKPEPGVGDADTLDGQDGAYYLSRGNHTGSQLASTISDLDTAVRDAGRWEVVVSGNPAAAVTTPDGSDWVYGWVSS